MLPLCGRHITDVQVARRVIITPLGAFWLLPAIFRRQFLSNICAYECRSRSRRAGFAAPPDLLTVTAERLRRALGRSFLRYGVSGDPEIAVHAAMNVFEPVLDARDTEILRLRRLMGGKLPGR